MIFIKNVVPTGFGFGQPTVSGILIDDSGMITDLNASDPGVATVIDGQGAYLCPDWADMHTHIWYGGTDLGLPVNEAGAPRGVTTLLDAGSAGVDNFVGFREFIWTPATADGHKIVSFLNIGSGGLVATNTATEIPDWQTIDFPRIVQTIDDNLDVIGGIKLRASGVICREWGITPVLMAKKLSRITSLPLMCHVGEAPPNYEDVINVLQDGDIVSHTFNGKIGGSIAEDPVLENAVKDAVARGVYLDIGHGEAWFNFNTFSYCLANGIKPDSVSTDIHDRNVNGPVLDLATTMSKTLQLGLTFDETIAGVTLTPRTMLGLPTVNLLAVGKRADFTIFDLAPTDETVYDSNGNALQIDNAFEPRWAIMGSNAVAASRNVPTAAQREAMARSGPGHHRNACC